MTAVVGTARVVDVKVGDPREIWSHYQKNIDLTRSELDAYVEGAAKASAVLLADASRLPSPLTLADLRAVTPFRPPRSYRNLTLPALREMVDGHVRASDLLARCT